MSRLQEVFDCDQPVALVTGSGAPRVGREIAVRLAQAGCRIALHANDSLQEAENAAREMEAKFQREILVTHGALEEETTPSRIVEECIGRFGRIDVLVNSAAIWSPTRLIEVTAAEIRRYFEINTIASFLAARAAASQMVSQSRGGSIVNIGDWATVRPYLDHAAYFPSKGAVETMTRSLAVEFAHMNPRIRVNCIQPGPVLMGDEVPEAQVQKIAESTLAKRVGEPIHVAHAVQFLCENDFVTGICLPVDGGRTIFAPDGLQVGMNTG